MKNSLLTLATILLFTSCAKEEFAVNKGKQTSSAEALSTTSAKLCAQSTLIKPPVDILMLWDNSTSFNVVNPATRASMGNLISSISENFDYHILSVPLMSSNSNTLYEAQLVAAKDMNGNYISPVNGTALAALRTKEQVASSLSFTPPQAAAQEPGVDRALNIIQQNRANGIFRQNAYTMIVVISNEDDDSCEMETGFNPCSDVRWKDHIQPKINKLLCLRGNTYVDCSTAGVSPLNSTMMRFINISPLTSCAQGNYKFNSRYKMVADKIYSASYSNGWPTSVDHISAETNAHDSYNLCSISFSNIFDGVNTAIKQTLLRHKYNYWPAASANADIDPDTIRVTRSDGKILTNRTGESNPSNGFAYIGNGSVNTRFSPTAGEPFTGKLIQLFGTDANDYIVYPDCLTVTFDGVKSTYGYVYLQYGQASEPTIQVFRSINGGSYTAIPKSTTNGWSYLNYPQYVSSLDPNLKVLNMPAGTPSGYFINLNGSYRFQNSTSTTTTIRVDYNSQTQ